MYNLHLHLHVRQSVADKAIKKKVTSGAEDFKKVKVVHANTMGGPLHILATPAWRSCNRGRMSIVLNYMYLILEIYLSVINGIWASL